MILWILMSLLAGGLSGGEVAIEAKPLKRNQLPDGFPLQVQDVGFAVIRVQLHNRSTQAWDFDPQELKVFSPKKKRLKQASPEEIAPKLMKLYSKTRRGVHGEAYGGRQPTPTEWERVPTLDPGRSPGTLNVNRGQRLRELLKDFQLAASVLQPGQTLEGLLYVKSKRTGSQLYGGFVQLEDGTSATLR